jgi:hypothetical protein
MIADDVPEIARSLRLGHRLDNRIVETYSHVATEVEHRLLEALQHRWHTATGTVAATPRTAGSYRDAPKARPADLGVNGIGPDLSALDGPSLHPGSDSKALMNRAVSGQQHSADRPGGEASDPTPAVTPPPWWDDLRPDLRHAKKMPSPAGSEGNQLQYFRQNPQSTTRGIHSPRANNQETLPTPESTHQINPAHSMPVTPDRWSE